MNPFLTREVFYPAYHALKGTGRTQKLREFRRNERMSPEELSRLQQDKLRRLLQHAYENTAFYRERMDSAGLDPTTLHQMEHFRRLPLLGKKEINANREAMVSRIADRNKLKLGSTSGSTGESLKFYKDFNCGIYRQAATVRGNAWAGFRVGDKAAALWGAPMDLSKGATFRGRLYSMVVNKILLSSYLLNQDTMHQYARRLRAFKPRLILSYPGPLVVFAEYLLAENIRLPSVKAVITSAETLFPWQREIAEQTFACKVYNRYGSREFGNIAHECEKGEGLHIYTDRVVVEILNEDFEPVAPGETGEIVVTDLQNYNMPLIRYRIGDMAAYAGTPCSCGRPFPLLSGIEGRTLDVVVTESGSRIGGTFWSILFKTRSGISQFQVVQNELDGVTVHYVPEPGVEIPFKHFEKAIQKKCGSAFSVAFKEVTEIPKTESGKTQFVVSNLANR